MAEQGCLLSVISLKSTNLRGDASKKDFLPQATTLQGLRVGLAFSGSNE